MAMSTSTVSVTEEKKRKPNWSDVEMTILCQIVSENINILRSKFTPSITHEKKTKIWRSITERVNSVTFTCERSLDEVKKRWQDAQSSVKNKEASQRKTAGGTGGGPPPDVFFKAWELVVLATLSPIAIEGITGGVDTASTSRPTSSNKDPERVEEMPEDVSSEVDESSIFIYANSAESETPKKDRSLIEKEVRKSSSTTNSCDMQQKYLQMEMKKMESKATFRKEILELERRKVVAFESISISLNMMKILERPSTNCHK